jgi:hypothetical protein
MAIVYDKLMARGHLSFRVNMAQLWRPEDFVDAAGHVKWEELFAKADAVRRKDAQRATDGASPVLSHDGPPTDLSRRAAGTAALGIRIRG